MSLWQIAEEQSPSNRTMTAPSWLVLTKVHITCESDEAATECGAGMVYLCTTQYSSRYLHTYHAHNTPVYNIQWNTFIPNIFITCASEWIIKIWDKDCK